MWLTSISVREAPSSWPGMMVLMLACAHFFVRSLVKWGSCSSTGSDCHMAWMTIWFISMAAIAGLSQLLLVMTSTQACSRRVAVTSTRAWSVARSPDRFVRVKWACRQHCEASCLTLGGGSCWCRCSSWLAGAKVSLLAPRDGLQLGALAYS